MAKKNTPEVIRIDPALARLLDSVSALIEAATAQLRAPLPVGPVGPVGPAIDGSLRVRDARDQSQFG